MTFYNFYEKIAKIHCLGANKGVLTKTTVAVFPTGSKKRESNNDDKHDHGQEKRRPSTYVEKK